MWGNTLSRGEALSPQSPANQSKFTLKAVKKAVAPLKSSSNRRFSLVFSIFLHPPFCHHNLHYSGKSAVLLGLPIAGLFLGAEGLHGTLMVLQIKGSRNLTGEVVACDVSSARQNTLVLALVRFILFEIRKPSSGLRSHVFFTCTPKQRRCGAVLTDYDRGGLRSLQHISSSFTTTIHYYHVIIPCERQVGAERRHPRAHQPQQSFGRTDSLACLCFRPSLEQGWR